MLVPFKARHKYGLDQQPSENERSKLLGALIEILAAGLGAQNSKVVESEHRLSQYAIFGDQVATALGYSHKYFSNLYATAKRTAAQDYAAGDPTVSAIVKFIKSQEAKAFETNTPPKAVEIRQARGFIIKRLNGQFLAGYTPKGLRLGAKEAIDSLPFSERMGFGQGFTFPETDRAMVGAMNRVSSSILKDLGFEIIERALGSEKNKEKLYLFQWCIDVS